MCERLMCAAMALAALSLPACGNSPHRPQGASAKPLPAMLPGHGRPAVTIGDKNFTEQFVLGELYKQALEGEGFTVVLNRNVGPPEVTMQALISGRLAMYPEYLRTWNSTIAGYQGRFASVRAAYRAAQRYAHAHGLTLLDRTPFSDSDAICVTSSYATQNGLRTIADLRHVAQTLTLGAAPQFQQSPDGLPALEQAYGFSSAAFRPLELGSQYQALDRGLVQAAAVNTTDGQLLSDSYRLLADPEGVFGSGNATPVVSLGTLASEGPAFAATINRVSRLLTLAAMRQLNAAVDVSHQDAATVARQFLATHRIMTANGG